MKFSYNLLATARYTEHKNLVISETRDEDSNLLGYSVTEQFTAEDKGNEIHVFLKRGLGILSKDAIKSLRDAFDSAYEQILAKEREDN